MVFCAYINPVYMPWKWIPKGRTAKENCLADPALEASLEVGTTQLYFRCVISASTQKIYKASGSLKYKMLGA